MREVLWIIAAGIILLIVGTITASLSARAIEARLIPQGNTEIMLREALDVAQEAGAKVEFVTVAGKDIKHGDACEKV